MPTAAIMSRWPEFKVYLQHGPLAGAYDNPLGARALYLGSSLYRIHGTNEPSTIGQNVSSGCIRMTNEDAIDLYNRVKVGTLVVVLAPKTADAPFTPHIASGSDPALARPY